MKELKEEKRLLANSGIGPIILRCVIRRNPFLQHLYTRLPQRLLGRRASIGAKGKTGALVRKSSIELLVTAAAASKVNMSTT